ncbi:type II toxin-antitoxin system HicA family toxin [uncultured Enterococcus sp.]|uniref:type II toxin-antitoxin system HicA family toxin n=1 Tax=uncultured Enterococcus sp. TaxID=167972 RepID=UPI0025EBF0E9|nr:type II toxin-antitoxin system HicA family toxin [uncultured Enterococcus sp.]
MPLTGKKMLKLALKNGWQEMRVAGSHHIVTKEGFLPVSIPVHGNKDLKKGIEQTLLRDLGLK